MDLETRILEISLAELRASVMNQSDLGEKVITGEYCCLQALFRFEYVLLFGVIDYLETEGDSFEVKKEC